MHFKLIFCPYLKQKMTDETVLDVAGDFIMNTIITVLYLELQLNSY